MLSRIARAGAVALCVAGLIGALGAGSAAAKPRAHSSVIGGSAASLQQWEFAVAVLTPTTLCTGTVISPTRVLTAGHCVGSPETMLVRANSTSAFAGGEALGVSAVTYAPGFARSFDNDLAILTLRSPTTAPAIQVANAAEDAAYTHPGAVLSLAGFGDRNPLIVGKPKFGLLTATDVSARYCPLPPWAICDSGSRVGTAFRRLKRKLRKRPVMRGVCSGDSGGPLVANTPEGPRLVGTAEASTGPSTKRNPFFFVLCGLKGYPSVHTRSYLYRDFIEANLG
ncbi:MAG TPA: trypsin-like serine protease [Solirubrobacterales bacterium]|nr:trypsin-like serine protease [Solirubrobacterales bacterium]